MSCTERAPGKNPPSGRQSPLEPAENALHPVRTARKKGIFGEFHARPRHLADGGDGGAERLHARQQQPVLDLLARPHKMLRQRRPAVGWRLVGGQQIFRDGGTLPQRHAAVPQGGHLKRGRCLLPLPGRWGGDELPPFIVQPDFIQQDADTTRKGRADGEEKRAVTCSPPEFVSPKGKKVFIFLDLHNRYHA